MKFYEKPCTFDHVLNTESLQVESLMRVAGALGYEPVYDKKANLVNFRGDRYQKDGMLHVSVNSMIKLHNKLGQNAWISTKNAIETNLDEFIANKGDENIIILLAHYTRLVKKIKMSFSKKRGFIVQSNKVEFYTKWDARREGF